MKNSEKVKFTCDFSFERSSVSALWRQISTASGMSEWFADEVFDGDEWRFVWKGSEQRARRLVATPMEKVRFRWCDDVECDESTYFELRICKDDVTRMVSILITDFAYEDEVDDAISLWEKQMDDLRHSIGV